MDEHAGYEQDATGQWWYRFSPTRRTRAAELQCENCGSLFRTWRGGRYCSRECAAEGRRPEGRDEEIERRYRAGETGKEIAEALDVSFARVYQVLRERGVGQLPKVVKPSGEKRQRGRARVDRVFTEAERESVREAFKAWAPLPEIARMLHTRIATASTLLREMGLEQREARKTRQRLMTRYERPDGYVMVWVDGRWRMEHRVFMEEHLGRPLFPYENVHHLNAVKNDNRMENLELWQVSQPSGRRAADPHCPTCTCFEDD